MKTYWVSNNKALKVGDTLCGYKIGRVTPEHIKDTEGNLLVWRRYYYSDLSGTAALAVKSVVIPDYVPFDRVTGKRLETADTTSTGALVTAVGSSFCKVKKDNRTTILSARPSAAAFAACVEMRREPDYDQYANGLSRTMNPESGEMEVLGIRGRRIPAVDSVWTGRCYRKRSEYVERTNGLLVLARAVPSGWVTTYDGLVGSPDSLITLADGEHAGKYARSSDAHYLSEYGWILRGELVVYYNSYGDCSYHRTVPERAEQLPTGDWSHPDNIVACAATGVRNMRHMMVRVGRVYYSNEYWQENGTHCEECGNAFIRTGDECECQDCRSGGRTRIRNYSNRTANGLPAERDVPIKFGIELEVGCDKGVDRYDCVALVADAFDSACGDGTQYCVYKHDGSLSDCDGFEIVTRPDCPSVHKRIFSDALRASRWYSRMTSFDNGHCGMHVHVSRAPLSELWVGRLLVLVNDSNTQPLIHAVAGRSGNRYTNYDSSKKLTSGRGDRYEALNVTSDHTVEFRMFRGTLNPTSFIKNIEFVEAALAFTRPASRSLRDINSPAKFAEFVSKSRKSYPHLHQFLTMKGFLCH